MIGRINGQGLPITALRLHPPPGFMVFQSLLNNLLGSHGWRYYIVNSPQRDLHHKRGGAAMKALVGLAFLALASVAAADALILDDGTRVEGKIHKDGDQWVLIDSSGNSSTYSPD